MVLWFEILTFSLYVTLPNTRSHQLFRTCVGWLNVARIQTSIRTAKEQCKRIEFMVLVDFFQQILPLLLLEKKSTFGKGHRVSRREGSECLWGQPNLNGFILTAEFGQFCSLATPD